MTQLSIMQVNAEPEFAASAPGATATLFINVRLKVLLQDALTLDRPVILTVEFAVYIALGHLYTLAAGVKVAVLPLTDTLIYPLIALAFLLPPVKEAQ